MANQMHKNLLTLTRQQLIALATQKEVAPYRDARVKTKGQLIALLCDVEGILTPAKTWEPVDDDALLDNDQRVIEELAIAFAAVAVAATAFSTDIELVQAAAAGCSG